MRAAAAAALLAAAVPPAAAVPAAAAPAGSGPALDHLSAEAAQDARRGPGRDRRARALAAWAVLAVTAAGEDPATWTGAGGSLLAALGPLPRTADPIRLARWTLAAGAAGRLGAAERRVAARLLAQRAAVPAAPLGAAWALLGLRAAGAAAPGAPAVLRAHLVATQLPAGGWAADGGERADTAATGAAAQALAAWGEDAEGPVLRRARAWLAATQRRDGGWGPRPGGVSTGVDTAWAVLALHALGADPAAAPWARRAGGPLARLRRMQGDDGGVADLPGGAADPLATRLAVLALRGARLPAPPRRLGPAADRRPRVVRRSPAPGGAPGARLVVLVRDEPGGTGVDPGAVRLRMDGRDVTPAARVTPFSLQVPAAGLGALPATAELRLPDRAGNVRVLRWRVGGRARPQ